MRVLRQQGKPGKRQLQRHSQGKHGGRGVRLGGACPTRGQEAKKNCLGGRNGMRPSLLPTITYHSQSSTTRCTSSGLRPMRALGASRQLQQQLRKLPNTVGFPLPLVILFLPGIFLFWHHTWMPWNQYVSIWSRLQKFVCSGSRMIS